MIPLIDLKGIPASPEDGTWASTAQELTTSLRDFGFVYLKNHGVSTKKVVKGFEVSRTFFEQPKEKKLLHFTEASPKGYHGQGYSEQEGGNVYELRESFDFTGNFTKSPNNDEDASFHEALKELELECKPLIETLLRLLSLGLEVEEDFFLNHSKWLRDPSVPSFKTFRALYYPRVPADLGSDVEELFRVKEHSDFGFLTLLFQDSTGGLEVKTRDGTWIPVCPIADTIIVNIGDILETWSGGYFPATKHRVRLPPNEQRNIARQSIAYFLHTDSNVLVSPIKGSPILGSYSFQSFRAYEPIKMKLANVKLY